MEGERLIRKRMQRAELPGWRRFITFSCNRRLPFLLSKGIASLLRDAIQNARTSHGMELFAWVIMPEHVHLLVRPPAGRPLAPLLAGIKIAVAKRVVRRWLDLDARAMLDLACDEHGRPQFWQRGGGFDRNVRNDAAFCKHVRYIHRNPVERGLVERPEDYPWSSARWWMGLRDGEVECDSPGGGEEWKRWQDYM